MEDKSSTFKFNIDGIPPLGQAFPLGMHLLVMIVGTVIVPIVNSG